MQLTEWLNRIDAVHPQEMELGLARIRQVAQNLDLLPVKVPVFTVAGTNGKGTTVACLDACLRKLGYVTGTYTSPHLMRINERFTVSGEFITDDALCAIFAQIDAVRGEILLTFFEYCVLAALCWFQQAAVDVVILEVGLGGRLDAVNIVDADVAIIASIALDHQAWLGDTRAEIAREKAGIARAGKPVICGDLDPPETLSAAFQSIGALAQYAGVDYHVTQHVDHWQWQGYGHVYSALPMPQIPLQNAATVLAALHAVPSIAARLTPEVLTQVLTQLQVPGRYQTFVLATGKTVVLDVAHNPHAAAHLAECLAKESKFTHTYALFSALADKDIKGIVQALVPHIDVWHYAALTDERAASLSTLAQALPDVAIAHDSVLQACQAVVAQMSTTDRLVILGSFFTVAAVLPWLIQMQAAGHVDA